MIYKPWNRSSAWSPEVLARLIAATNQAIQKVLDNFDTASLTAEERAAAYRLLCTDVTDGIAKFEESLRPHHVEVEEILKSK